MTRLLTRQSLQSSMCLTNKNLVLVRINPNILYRLRHFQVRRADEILLGTKLRPFNIEGYCILPGKKKSQFRVRLLWNLKLADTTVQDSIGFL